MHSANHGRWRSCPNGDILVTERAGRLRLVHDGRLASGTIGGVPPVDTRAQDGLMDLALHPHFAQNRTHLSWPALLKR